MRCLLRLGATGLIEVVSPYDAVTQAQLRAIRPRGSWSGRQRCWSFPLEAAAALQHALTPPQRAHRYQGKNRQYRDEEDTWPDQDPPEQTGAG